MGKAQNLAAQVVGGLVAQDVVQLGVFGEGLGHTMQAKGVKLVEGWMFEQVRLS